MDHRSASSPAQSTRFDDRFVLLIGPVFVLLGVWFFASSPKADVPIPPATKVSLERIAPGARREPTKTPEIENGDYTHKCVECHRVFDSRKQQSEKRVLCDIADSLPCRFQNEQGATP